VPELDLEEWERICRAEAARTTHPETKALLLKLAAEYSAAATIRDALVDPDERILQDLIARRLLTRAAELDGKAAAPRDPGSILSSGGKPKRGNGRHDPKDQ
jgi:hypothetical protein